MPSPQPDESAEKRENKVQINALAASPAEVSAHPNSQSNWFVQSRPLGTTVLDEWAELHACHTELPFYLHPDWLRSCNRSLFEDTLQVISVYRNFSDTDVNSNAAANNELVQMCSNDKIDAADAANRTNWLPSVMFAVRSNTGTSLLSPAHDHLTLGDLLIHPSLSTTDTTDAIAAVLQSDLAKRLEFGNLPNSSTLMCAVSGRNVPSRNTNLWVASAVRETAWFDLHADATVPSGKLRRNLNRLERKLKEKGDVEYRFTAGDELADAYQRFLQVEASGWKGTAGTEKQYSAIYS